MPRRQHVPLTRAAVAVLRAVVFAGAPASPDALLPAVGGSWRRLLDVVAVLDQRGLVRLRPGFVVATSAGHRSVRRG